MKISKKISQKQWFDFNKTVSFCIRPFPFSELIEQGTMEVLKQQFMYCVIDWKGLDDEDKSTSKKNVSFECTEENKLYLYDYSDAIRNFVWEKIAELDKNLSVLIKN